jgi:DNA-directed RNA polymerase specialized sigma24 family protein
MAVTMSTADVAFDRLVEPHLPSLRATAQRFTSSPQEAQDLLQESLAAALAGVDGLRDDRLAGAWLTTILCRKRVDHLRRRDRERRALAQPRPADAPSFDGEPVRRVLATLDPKSRRVLELPERFAGGARARVRRAATAWERGNGRSGGGSAERGRGDGSSLQGAA